MKMMKNEVEEGEEDEEEATSGQVAHFQAALRPNRGESSQGGDNDKAIFCDSFRPHHLKDAKG